MKSNTCECSDKGCSGHEGHSSCDGYASVLLMQIDMEDKTGEWLCANCSDDALASGVFRVADIKETITNRR